MEELKKKKVVLPPNPVKEIIDFGNFEYQKDALVSCIERLGKTRLNPKHGEEICNSVLISAYDESIDKFEGLQGTAYLTSHSVIMHGSSDYVPVNLLVFNFYTRILPLCKNSSYIKYSEEPDVTSKKDYVKDRMELLSNSVPHDSILFIDGPLIGGNLADATIKLNRQLDSRGIIPICFVKNSSSNMVTDRITELKGKYNSDLHWAYSFLKSGERTSFFKYEDSENSALSKVFCYIKAFDLSPQRIEFDLRTYSKYSKNIDDFIDLAYYLLLAQGDLKNPQLRSIAIAEKFARATLKLVSLEHMMRELGITPTMNQERFAY